MMSASFISALKRPLKRPSSGSSRGLVGVDNAFLSRNVGEANYVSNRMNGMPDMSRDLYLLRDGRSRERCARIHLRHTGSRETPEPAPAIAFQARGVQRHTASASAKPPVTQPAKGCPRGSAG
ncbi:hypothetical protein OKW40_004610 [Paraburkholderia sp. RAU6.4a]|uniref:hypothetical protein n=1 Tax=Paraburkholderia sp. RAU6.4a TaxID=2991067 RepID=UPI003D1FB547